MQAEGKSKFTCILPRRRLSKTRLKIMQAGAMPDLFGNARASKKPVSGTRALKQPDEGLFLTRQHDVGHTEAVARISALLGMPLEQRRCPGFLGDHGRPHTQFVAGDRDGKFAFAIGESLVIGTAEQVDRAKLIGGEPAQDIELGSSFDDDRSVLQEFEKPLGAEAFRARATVKPSSISCS